MSALLLARLTPALELWALRTCRTTAATVAVVLAAVLITLTGVMRAAAQPPPTPPVPVPSAPATPAPCTPIRTSKAASGAFWPLTSVADTGGPSLRGAGLLPL
ncbi:hypothetical protein ACWEO2_31545 [Nocardia sp. NPDC004278]